MSGDGGGAEGSTAGAVSPEAVPRVLLEQTLMKCEEVFVYRIPPLATAKGHHADDWNLASPVETCSLRVIHVDDSLYLRLHTAKPKLDGPKGSTEPHLFAQSHIRLKLNDPKPLKLEHWVEATIDSSRYFAIRISDEKTGREAHIGMGFRERNDASDFKMGLQEYENALRREKKAELMHLQYKRRSGSVDESAVDVGVGSKKDEALLSPVLSMSKLGLKEGEKIHINLKTNSRGERRKSVNTLRLSGKSGIPLLKKPAPAKAETTATVAVASVSDSASDNLNTSSVSLDVNSVEAVANEEDVRVGVDDDDEWGDFESST